MRCGRQDWPTASTVGIPAGTGALTVMADASYHTQNDGQVFDAVELQGRLYVDHDNVVIRRSRLVGDVYYAIYSTDGATDLTIVDSDILGGVLSKYAAALNSSLPSLSLLRIRTLPILWMQVGAKRSTGMAGAGPPVANKSERF